MIVRCKNNYQAYMKTRCMFISDFKYDYISIGQGAFDPFIILFSLLGRKCCRIWMGTDVLKVTKFWDYRIRAKIQSIFCDNLTMASWLTNELKLSGIESKELKSYADTGLLSKEYNKKN